MSYWRAQRAARSCSLRSDRSLPSSASTLEVAAGPDPFKSELAASRGEPNSLRAANWGPKPGSLLLAASPRGLPRSGCSDGPWLNFARSNQFDLLATLAKAVVKDWPDSLASLLAAGGSAAARGRALRALWRAKSPEGSQARPPKRLAKVREADQRLQYGRQIVAALPWRALGLEPRGRGPEGTPCWARPRGRAPTAGPCCQRFRQSRQGDCEQVFASPPGSGWRQFGPALRLALL